MIDCNSITGSGGEKNGTGVYKELNGTSELDIV